MYGDVRVDMGRFGTPEFNIWTSQWLLLDAFSGDYKLGKIRCTRYIAICYKLENLYQFCI